MPLFNSTPAETPVVIIGAGAFGMAAAAQLRMAGYPVTVVAPEGCAASVVAAGMIAPAMETAIDGLSGEIVDHLKLSRVLWDVFASRTGVELAPMRSEWKGEGADRLARGLWANHFVHEYDVEAQVIVTDEDAKLDPVQALKALEQGITRINANAEAVFREGTDWHVVTSEGVVVARQLVLATGASAAIAGLPEVIGRIVGTIIPIRGLIGITKARLCEHVVRGPGAYIASVNAGPYAGGSVIGATMETGVRDLEPDMDKCGQMLEAAAKILGGLPEGLEMEWRAGIRGASTDGLPMVGSVGDGLTVALAPRRNGWLLAPLVAEFVQSAVEGSDGIPASLDPYRFFSLTDRNADRR